MAWVRGSHRVWLSLFGVLLCAAADETQRCAAPAADPTTAGNLAELPADTRGWSVSDVASWVSKSLWYPEHAALLKEHAVDGPTLFYLSESDLDYIGVGHPVHRKKILAHIDILRGRCMCTSPAAVDFWEFAAKNTYKAVVLGAFIEFSPRVGIAWLLARDGATVASVLGSVPDDSGDELPLSWTAIAVLAAAATVVPHGLIAAVSLIHLGSNPFLSIAMLIGHSTAQVTEAQMFWSTWRGLVELGYKVTNWSNFLWHVDHKRREWLRSCLYPLPVLVAGVVTPWLVVWVAMLLRLGFVVLHAVAVLLEKGTALWMDHKEQKGRAAQAATDSPKAA